MNLKELYQKATPLPLVLLHKINPKDVSLWGDDGARLFGHLRGEADGEPLAINAALAAHAVNVLPELVEALQEATDFVCRRIVPDDPLYDRLTSILHKANNIEMKGEKS